PGRSVRVGHLVHENVRNKTRVRAGGGLRRVRLEESEALAGVVQRTAVGANHVRARVQTVLRAERRELAWLMNGIKIEHQKMAVRRPRQVWRGQVIRASAEV